MAVWGTLVCPERSRNEIRALPHGGNEAVLLSQLPIRNLDMKSGIVHLGLPDLSVLTVDSGGR